MSNCHLVFKHFNVVASSLSWSSFAPLVKWNRLIFLCYGSLQSSTAFYHLHQLYTEVVLPALGAFYLSALTCTFTPPVFWSVFLLSLQHCRGCDRRCLQESMRFIYSSFALSVSVISASLLNTRGALGCCIRLNHLPHRASKISSNKRSILPCR